MKNKLPITSSDTNSSTVKASAKGTSNFKMNHARNVIEMLNTARVNSRLVKQTESAKKKYMGVRSKLFSPKQSITITDDLFVNHKGRAPHEDLQPISKEILLHERPYSPAAQI